MKKKIFLASFMQKENFGKGKIISITSGDKPRDLEVKHIYLPFTPPRELIETYNKTATVNQEEAGALFTSKYKAQLDEFVEEVISEAKKEEKSPTDLLPFETGDTFCSWERNYRTNYRKILAPYLEKLGYEVELN